MTLNWDVVSAVSEVVGAAAVVISLIYLAVQIRQNTNAIRGATLDAITAHMQAELRWSSDMPNVMRKAIEDPESLSWEESWHMSEWVTAAFTARQNEYHQYRQGLLDDDVWESIENIIRLLIGMDWVRNWWTEYGRNNLAHSFVQKVESIAAEQRRDVEAELSDVLSNDR